MGTELGVVDNFNSYCGTLGGFVQLPNGEVGALTCAHVMGIYSGTSGEVPSKLVTQPSLDTCWNDNSLQRYF